MSNLYIFAIGGTGARVLRSLTMLSAAGVEINADKIIPIIIDTDTSNGDTQRTTQLLVDYYELKKQFSNYKGTFFKNNLCPLSEFQATEAKKPGVNDYVLKLPNVTGTDFKTYIKFNNIPSEETKKFLELIYSEENLNNSLTHGFLGSPNVGSVVLESITESNEFSTFCTNFANGDKLFIISSIFGGTGAAGFPLLLNSFNNGVTKGAVNAIKQSMKGAITVLPYFKLNKDGGSPIDSNSFITKSIAALSYYENNMNDLNALYYIGDSNAQKIYDNHEGGKEQCNLANFVEVAAAMSIVDFSKLPDGSDGIFKEFAYEVERDQFVFSDLGRNTQNIIDKPLVKFQLLSLINEEIQTQIGSTFMSKHSFNNKFFSSVFYDNLKQFLLKHEDWLRELNENNRGFSPFNKPLSTDYSNLINQKPSPGIDKKSLINCCAEPNAASSLPIVNEKYLDVIDKATEILFKRI
jgi:hypothetical protein